MMIECLKKYNLVDEMEKHVLPDEDIFVECYPNKIPFVLRKAKQPLIIILLLATLIFLYMIIRPFLGLALINCIDLILILVVALSLFFLGQRLFYAFLDARNSYYVITTRGIHILRFEKSFAYTLYSYTDIKSIILQDSIFDIGNIYIKEMNEKLPSHFIDKFLYERNGLIAIDEPDKVFDVLKQIAIQENPSIFFADSADDNVDIDYFKDVKKYSNKIEVKKDDSIINRRSQ